VKVGGRYVMEQGFIRITRMRQIAMSDITPELARQSGFSGVVDLLKTAKHGPGEKVYLIEFVSKTLEPISSCRPPRRPSIRRVSTPREDSSLTDAGAMDGRVTPGHDGEWLSATRR